MGSLEVCLGGCSVDGTRRGCRCEVYGYCICAGLEAGDDGAERCERGGCALLFLVEAVTAGIDLDLGIDNRLEI